MGRGAQITGASAHERMGIGAYIAGHPRVSSRRIVRIALWVLASWLAAIAVLGTALRFLPVTPGYLPDHLE